MRLEEQRRVQRPQAEVFAYTADFSHIDQWDPGVARSAKIGEGPVGVGTRFEVDAKFGSSVIPMIYEVTVYEPPSRVVLAGRSQTLDALDDIRFHREGDVTVIDYTADLTFHNFVRFVAPLMKPVFNGVGRRALDGLADVLS